MPFKYKVIKALDIAGLKVLEPVVHLVTGEQPGEQFGKIVKFIFVPIIVFSVFLMTWSFVAPRHKTKYGEVPTPTVVLEAYEGIKVFHTRENTKESDYLATGEERQQLLEQTKKQLSVIDPALKKAETELEAIKAEHDAELKSKIAPLEQNFEDIKVTLLEKSDERELNIMQLAAKVDKSDIKTKNELVIKLREHEQLLDQEQAQMDEAREKINAALLAKNPELLEARQRVTALVEEKIFLEKRLDQLGNDNREMKVAEAQQKLDEYQAALASATGKDIIKYAKRIIRTENSIDKIKTSTAAVPWTFFEQIGRSLTCAFLGFFIGTIIAIPLGVICGLSPIMMASMTPLISLFKPVSPIVWLPIALIIVGGFFANPDEAFIQPSFLASAITVALCSLWPTLVNTALGVAAIDKDHINVARVLKLGFWSRLFKIVIPSALPLIFAGLRISLGVGWMVLIAAELLSSSEGIGKYVWDMFNNGSSQTFAQMFVVVFFVGVIGMLLDRIMIVFQRLVSFDGAPTAI